ncbi:MAG: enoyl-CoA hydratase/isomerase family protein [Actinomycetota bacterium]
MSDDPQILTARGDGIATITLHRPDALNAITPRMLREIVAELESIGDDESISVVVLTGTGRAFSAGVDLKALGGGDTTDGEVGGDLNTPARRVTELLGSMPQATIAKVNGFCFTGAMELAIACDLVVVAEEAKLGDTHAKWGLRPTWGMSQRLPRLVGMQAAKELSFTARTITGTEAAAMGMALRAVPLDELDDAVGALAAEIAANSPGSIAAYKDLYREAADRALSEGLAYEASTDYRIPDTRERLTSFAKK